LSSTRWILVAVDLHQQLAGRDHTQLDAPLARERVEVGAREVHQLAQVERREARLELACIEARNVEQVGDVSEQRACVARHQLELLTLLAGQLFGLQQQVLHRTQDERERRTELVADVGEEVGLELIELEALLVGGAELGHGHLQCLAALARQPCGGDQLRRFGQEARQHQRGAHGGDGGDRAQRSVEPVARLPDDQHIDEVRQPAADDEHAECDVHEPERQLSVLEHEHGEQAGDGDVRQSNQQVGPELQPHQLG
jgi:hypothetical protein